MISRAQHERILDLIASAVRDGANVATGGRRPTDPALQDGFFIEPTIIIDVRQHMRIAREEVFGPVLSVLRWSDEEEMLKQVNSVEYGLPGAVFTKDLVKAHRAASRLQSGYIWINNTADHMIGAPFGGYKQSGSGREESIEELHAFSQLKTISLRLD